MHLNLYNPPAAPAESARQTDNERTEDWVEVGKPWQWKQGRTTKGWCETNARGEGRKKQALPLDGASAPQAGAVIVPASSWGDWGGIAGCAPPGV
jgi:hypothetical protein